MTRTGPHNDPAQWRECKLRLSRAESLAELVEVFKRECLPLIQAELAFYAQQCSLEAAIQAATSKGHSHSHLKLISPDSLRAAERNLLGSTKLRNKLSDFEQLYAAVEEGTRGIWKNALLTTYDIAHRIGAYLRLYPEEVYLHRGSKEGANALRVGRGKRKVKKQEFPNELQCLEPQFIEDFLCICKHELLRLRASNPADQADS